MGRAIRGHLPLWRIINDKISNCQIILHFFDRDFSNEL